MNVSEARAINASARKTGTMKFTAEERAIWLEAREVMHRDSMENDSQYRRQFRQMYNNLAVGTGRMDLVGKHG